MPAGWPAAALALALASVAAPARADEDGWAAYDAGHFTEAVRAWQPAAEAGNVRAQFGLGIAYDLGQGVEADSLAACGWYARAGTAGYAMGAFNAAVMQDAGRCGPRRADLAAWWYARAAAAGHPRAQFNLALLYSAGDGVPRNADAAAAWFRAAAANGVSAAAGRAQSQPRAVGDRLLLPVVPLDGSPVPPTAGGLAVLAWAAPAQPGRVRFFLELAALHPDGPQEVLARWVDESAVQVRLPDGGASYAWRVLTVGTDSNHYAATPWQPLDARP